MSSYPRWRWYEPKGRVGVSHACGMPTDSWQGMRRSYQPRNKCEGCRVAINEAILERPT